MKNIGYGKIVGLSLFTGALLFCLPGRAQVVTPCFAPSGMVAWYQGESNTVDHVAGNNGTFNGTPAYASGEVNRAFDFNGASYVSVSNAPQLSFTNTMTVEAWIKLRTYNGANSREIASKFGATSDLNCFTLALDPSNHKAYFTVNSANNTAWVQLYSATTIPTNEWTHIAGVADGSNIKIYINGELSNSTNWVSGIHTANSALTIGCTMQSVPTSYFNGQIDELSLYNEALSDCDIQAIYLTGPTGKCQ